MAKKTPNAKSTAGPTKADAKRATQKQVAAADSKAKTAKPKVAKTKTAKAKAGLSATRPNSPVAIAKASAKAPAKASAKSRSLNPPVDPKVKGGAPASDQDSKRRLGNFEGAGEHSRVGGRTSGIVGQTKQKNKTDKKSS